MPKSRKTRLFTVKDGRRARFNLELFQHACTEKTSEFKKELHQAKGAHAKCLAWLVQELYDLTPESQQYDSMCARVKQWRYGNNGPSELEDIYRLAEIFGKDRYDYFLKYERRSSKECDNTMRVKENAQPMETNKPNLENKSLIQMQTRNIPEWVSNARSTSQKEMEVAHELYCMFVDLIQDFSKTDVDVWFGLKKDTPEWKAAAKGYPERNPIFRAIAKSAFYVPKDVRSSAYGLLEEMYGGYIYEWEEADASDPLSLYLDHKYRQYDAYLESVGIDPDSAEAKDEMNFYDFIFEQIQDWPWKLNQVFSDYIQD